MTKISLSIPEDTVQKLYADTARIKKTNQKMNISKCAAMHLNRSLNMALCVEVKY